MSAGTASDSGSKYQSFYDAQLDTIHASIFYKWP